MRVLEHAEHRERVFHVGRLEELEAAELDERDVAAEQLDLEHVGVVRGAEEHRLVLERCAALSRREHGAADGVGLARFVQTRLEHRRGAARAFGPSSLTSAASVSGTRELLSTTSCPVETASRATWLPM